jgi:hypothetical protein
MKIDYALEMQKQLNSDKSDKLLIAFHCLNKAAELLETAELNKEAELVTSIMESTTKSLGQ